MEHRWGERVVVRRTVELRYDTLPPMVGSLENVSSSGAFVRIEGRRPPRGRVEIMLTAGAAGRSVRLAAYVVRETGVGVGIEWRDFAPRVVKDLLTQGPPGSPARTRISPASRPAPLAPDVAMTR